MRWPFGVALLLVFATWARLTPAASADMYLDECALAHGCPLVWRGDGECEPSCYNEECNLDGGDCGNEEPDECALTRGCPMTYRGDGECDSICYNEECEFDDGDCGKCALTHGCPLMYKGDGECDIICYNEECNLDDGDCGNEEPDECALTRGCPKIWRGDGHCHNTCNTKLCLYDDGDCNPTFAEVPKSFLTFFCMCLVLPGIFYRFVFTPWYLKRFDDFLNRSGYLTEQLKRKRVEFFNHTSSFYVCRKAMNEKWASLSDGSIEAFPAVVNKIELPDNTFDESMRQQSLAGRVVENYTELFEAATVALLAYDLSLRALLRSLVLPDRYLIVAPLKSERRAREKANSDYHTREPGPGFSWLFDIVRASILCESTQQILAVLKALCANDNLQVCRLKNRFKKSTPGGCRDINLNLRIKIPSRDGRSTVFHMCELQIRHKVLDDLDKSLHAHADYEFFRVYFLGNTDAVEARLKLMDKVFAGGANISHYSAKRPAAHFEDSFIPSPSATVAPEGGGPDGDPVQSLVAEVISLGNVDAMDAFAQLCVFMCDIENAIKLRMAQLKILGWDSVSTLSQLAELLMEPVRAKHRLDFWTRIAVQACQGYETRDKVELAARIYEKVITLLGGEVYRPSLLNLFDYKTHQWAPFPEGSVDLRKELFQALVGRAECFSVFQNKRNSAENTIVRDSPVNAQVLATKLFKLAEYKQELALGPDHEETLRTRKKHAAHLLAGFNVLVCFQYIDCCPCMSCTSTSKESEVIRMYKDIIEGQSRCPTLGPAHPETVDTIRCMAVVLEEIGEWHQARELYEDVLEKQTRGYGPDHVETLAAKDRLEKMVFEHGKLFYGCWHRPIYRTLSYWILSLYIIIPSLYWIVSFIRWQASDDSDFSSEKKNRSV